MNEEIDYIVCGGVTIAHLCQAVREAQRRGYITQGGPFRLPVGCVDDTAYAQAMVKRVDVIDRVRAMVSSDEFEKVVTEVQAVVTNLLGRSTDADMSMPPGPDLMECMMLRRSAAMQTKTSDAPDAMTVADYFRAAIGREYSGDFADTCQLDTGMTDRLTTTMRRLIREAGPEIEARFADFMRETEPHRPPEGSPLP